MQTAPTTGCPRLAPQILLQCEPLPAAHVLRAPNGDIQLNSNAAAVLNLCDGTRRAVEIVRDFARWSGKPAHMMVNDVYDFLRTALNHGWIIDDAAPRSITDSHRYQ